MSDPARHKQKRRKDSIIVSVLIPVATLEKIQSTIDSQNKNSRSAPLNKSEWIRRAIDRDLNHSERSRVKRRSAGRVNNTLNTVPGEMLHA